MIENKRSKGLTAYLKHSRALVLSLAVICIFALVGVASDTSESSLPGIGDRVIQMDNSPVRVVFKGDKTYSISLDGETWSRDLPQKRMIRLDSAQFDPLVNQPKIDGSKSGRVTAPAGLKLYIVQCYAQAIVPFQKRITAAGGEISGTLPENALLVVMNDETRSKVAGMNFVRWIGDYDSRYKLLEGAAKHLELSSAKAGKTHYSLWLTKKNKRDTVADYITSIGGEVVLKGKGRRMEANLDAGQLQQTADHAYVLAIDPKTAKEDDMDIVRSLSGADYVESVQGYTGQGVRGEVMDGGLRTTHDDFQANPPLINAGNSSSTSHGTPVYGIVFGDGTANASARGLIPDAEQPIFSCYNCFSDRYAHTQGLVNPSGSLRAVFQTNSWGDARTFNYTSISAEMDEIIFDLDILITQSQSNAGNQDSRPQAWAKNIVSVGGVRHYNTETRTDDCWCSSASIGPASDGRIKPDLWHFYDNTLAPYYTSDTSYTQFGGTSGATPITAGHFGLAFQMWADGVFDGGPGKGRDVFNNRPHATTAKALMIHSAYQTPFSGPGDDKTRVHQGWGMPDVKNLYDMAQANSWGFPVLVNETDIITPLGTNTYNMTVSGSGPLKVTMVYADPAGVPGASVHRVNDLSLKVTSPGGTVYWGNNGLLNGIWSTSGGSSNTIDTVENVFIQNPAAGSWTIQVLGDEIVQDGHVETPAIDADYALIASGGDSTPVTPPDGDPSGLSATAAACDQIDLSWTDNSSNETSFKIERSTDGVNFSQIDTAGSNATSYSDTSVAESTTYWYRVRASNSAGDSNYSNSSSATTPACPSNPPASASNLSLKVKGKSKITLSWNDNSNNEDGFRIYRGLSAGSMTLLTTVGANTTSYTNTGLSSKTTYYYQVCSYNADGEGCSATASATTK